MNRMTETVYTDNMKKKGTAYCFRSLCQNTLSGPVLMRSSFAEIMDSCKNTGSFKRIMGFKE
jgi:hypothetical protein